MFPYAADFAPDIRFMYNASGSSIANGTCVARDTSTVRTVQDPGREDGSVTMNILGIKAVDDLFEENFLGIAVEAIADGDWGPVCIGGPCEALVQVSVTAAGGDPYTADSTAGRLVAATSPYTIVHAHCLDTGAVAASALMQVYIEKIGLKSGGGATTA